MCARLHCDGPVTIKYQDAHEELSERLRCIEAAKKDADERKTTIVKTVCCMRNVLGPLSKAASSPENEELF